MTETDTKNKKMTFIALAFATAVTVVVLFVRRRAKRRPDDAVSAHCHAAVSIAAESINARECNVEGSGVALRLETEEKLRTVVDGEPITEWALALEEVDSKDLELRSDAYSAEIAAGPVTTDPASRSEHARPETLDSIVSSAVPPFSFEDAASSKGGVIVAESAYSSSGLLVPAGDENSVVETIGLDESAQTGTPLLYDEIPLIDVAAERPRPFGSAKDRDSEQAKRVALRYRPPAQRPPQKNYPRPLNQGAGRAGTVDVGLEMRVRLKFDRFDFCEVTILPERRAGLDSEVEVKSGGLSLHLIEQEDWFQDLSFENIGECLRHGLELEGLLGDNRRVKWRLSGRDIYVLASHPRASYFVSTTRLALGRSHVVLCILEQLQQVEAILSEAGCQGYTQLGESQGVPHGWILIRGVSPTKPIPLQLGVDPFYALKPVPELEIEFVGGVCLRNSVWLEGYPPQIKLLGDLNDTVKVLIDGEVAQRSPDGYFVAEGGGFAGAHSVYCEGLSLSRTYSIEEPPDSWEAWPAYHFRQADICGPLVQLTPQIRNRRALSVPMSNPLLLGAEPGQIFYCSSRRVINWRGFVPFEVVWALPAQPLRCDKKTAKILQFSDAAVLSPKTTTSAGLSWSAVILDASRKGLRVESGFPDAAMRWRDYKKVAQSIRRGAR